MGIRSFLKSRKNFIQDRESEKGKLNTRWHAFLSRDTYLTYPEKDSFQRQLNRISKFPWHYWLSIKIFLNRNKNQKEIEKFWRDIHHYNGNFVERHLDKHASFFEGTDDKLSFPLDIDQRKAIIKDDMHNLVIAGAGSGKTSVITSRIAYLIRRDDKVDPSKILALAFTRVAAKEMEERIERDYKLEVKISTFHSLGWKILKDNFGKKPSMIFGGGNTIVKEKELFSRLLKSYLKKSKNQKRYIQYMAYHNEQDLPETSFSEKQDYYEYMQNRKYVTLDNKTVKSYSEREIANFLFIHNIKFEYEPLVEWTDKKEDKEYHPDFYLPDYDIYIEHWGLNRELKVPKWFSTSSEKYNHIRKWKSSQFEKYEKKLVETWEYERFEEKLLKNLKKTLVGNIETIEFNRLAYQELVERTYEFKEKTTEVIDLIIKFIKTAKSNIMEIKEIEQKVRSKNYTKKQKLFAKIALGIYKRYERELEIKKIIDYNDMINRAIKIIKQNPKRYTNKYDHILIDEF